MAGTEKISGDRVVGKTRPKYAEDLVEFEKASFAALGAGLEAGDLPSVEAAMRAAITASDTYHGKWQKPYLRFRLPNRPPDFLDTRGDR